MLSCKLLHQVEAAGRVVAVNTFFIFMQQGDIVMRSLCNHRLHPEKHLGAAVCRSIVFRDIEAEHTDIGRFEDVCHLFRMGKLLQVRIEIIVNSDFADRRADGGNADICLIELFLYLFCKIHRKIGYIYAVRAAQLDVGNAEPGKHFDLAV